MKKLLLILLLILPGSYLPAQSLCHPKYQQLLKTHTSRDTLRAHLLIDFIYSGDGHKRDTISKLNAELKQLSKELNFDKGLAYASILEAREHLINYELSTALELIQQADSLSGKISVPDLNYQVAYIYATYYGDMDLAKSQEYGYKALKKAEQLNIPKYLAASNLLLSNSNYSLGKYLPAIEHGEKAIEYALRNNNKNQILNSYSQLANTYTVFGNYAKARELFSQIYAPENWNYASQEQKANYYNNYGEVFRLTKDYKTALEYYFKAQDFSVFDFSKAVFISNIGKTYESLNQLDSAKKYSFRSLEMAKAYSIESLYGWIYYTIASIHNKENRYDSAIYYGEAGLEIARKTGLLEDLRYLTQTLAESYHKKKNFEKAYNYFTEYIGYRDTMAATDVQMKTAIASHEYEMNLKQTQIDSLFEQKKTQNWLLWSIAAVLLLIVIVALLLLRNNRQKQKAYSLLEKQKLEINNKAKELSLQKENLQRSYENIQLLGDIGRKITSSLSIKDIISTVYQNVNKLMDASILAIGIYDPNSKSLQFPSTFENGEALPPYAYPIDDPNRLSNHCFKTGETILINDYEQEIQKYVSQPPKPIAGQQPHSLIYLPLKANNKTAGVLTVQSFEPHAYNEYHVTMLKTIALYSSIALENAESYKQLKNTVHSLQSTQKQLIQSEKMASLGELTAGIAHEIQNPLNFVTNFSDICRELTVEMKEELNAKHYEEANKIADDLIENQNKILHHSKRADSIVKGMLQHSRASTGQKENISINTLVDEYLRLAYHGLRAKDKSFNATLNIDLDPANPITHLVPQDIGRVLLNIITNAFHAMQGKKASAGGDYQPVLSLKTRVADKILTIEIKDNANGVPEHLREKIFQPFFTTKSAGQGTGLGLSLAYDIAKAHGGSIRLESSSGQGSVFTIEIPV